MTDQEALLLELDRLAALDRSTEHPLVQQAHAEYDALSDEEKLILIRENLKLTPGERIERNFRRIRTLFEEAGEPMPKPKI